MKQTDTIIIGGGISGLTVAFRLQRTCYGHHFIVLEKEAQTGGAARTLHEDGVMVELGPHGYLDSCAESNALVAEAGLSDECVSAPLSAFARYIVLGGRLRMIPQTPLKVCLSPLMSWREKFRVAREFTKKPLPGEPSVAEWVAHKFGTAMLPFADAVFTGTYAGDIERLAIDAVMPGMRRLEKEHGSLLRGGLRKILCKGHRNTVQRQKGLPAMINFMRGMERLPQKLTEYLEEGKNLFCNCTATGITRKDNLWQVETAQGTFCAPNLVVTLPINQALQLLAPCTETPPTPAIPEAAILTAVFTFPSPNRLPPGFGYLAPEQENRFALGALFSSNMFPGRAPAGQSMLEVLIGGRRHPDRLALPDKEILANALQDIKEILPLEGEPTLQKVVRGGAAIPQAEHGYTDLLKWRERVTKEFPGLYISGFGWEGIGLNNMTKTAFRAAEKICAPNTKTDTEAQIKKIYF